MIQMQSRLAVSSYNVYDERQVEGKVAGDSIHDLNAVSSEKEVAIGLV